MRLRSSSNSRKKSQQKGSEEEHNVETESTSRVAVHGSNSLGTSNENTFVRKIMVRTVMGCCMVAFYCAMLRGGYMYCILVGVLTQV